jgi:hypothetical protein
MEVCFGLIPFKSMAGARAGLVAAGTVRLNVGKGSAGAVVVDAAVRRLIGLMLWCPPPPLDIPSILEKCHERKLHSFLEDFFWGFFEPLQFADKLT